MCAQCSHETHHHLFKLSALDFDIDWAGKKQAFKQIQRPPISQPIYYSSSIASIAPTLSNNAMCMWHVVDLSLAIVSFHSGNDALYIKPVMPCSKPIK